MDSQFWKLLGTLFGIGAAVSLAKYMKSKSKKKPSEVLAEMIINGFFACGATAVWVAYPTVSPIAIVGIGIIGAILGVTFFSHQLEKFIGKWTDKDG